MTARRRPPFLTRLAHDSGGKFVEVKLDGEKP